MPLLLKINAGFSFIVSTQILSKHLPLLLLLLCFSLQPQMPLQAQPASHQTLIVISDLHLGTGTIDTSSEPAFGPTWHPFEDFRWIRDFENFLGKLRSKFPDGITLVLAGDIFELWQSTTADCPEISANLNLGCSESEALLRLQRVIKQHQQELSSLAAFATHPNEVVILPGNHDAALLFPSLQTYLLSTLGNLPTIRFESSGTYVSPDGEIVVEHGHQLTGDTNAFKNWPTPFLISDHSGSSTRHLQRTFGERFVQAFFNDYERFYPTIDNTTSNVEAAKELIREEPIANTAAGLTSLVRFLLFDTSLAQLSSVLGNNTSTDHWDLPWVRSQGDSLLPLLIPAAPEFDAIRNALLEQPLALNISISEFTNDELIFLCTRQALSLPTESPEAPACAKPGTLGGVLTALGDPNRALIRRLQDLSELLTKHGQPSRFSTYIYGHSHIAQPPITVSTTDREVVVANSGAWQRIVHARELPPLATKAQKNPAKALAVLRPEDLPACYTYVMITPDDHQTPLLRSWQVNASGRGKIRSGGCLD